jgi:hypothetical protein
MNKATGVYGCCVWAGQMAKHLFVLDLFAQLFASRQKVEEELG